MERQPDGASFDVDEYRENTADLVDSIDRTTELVTELAGNMDRLSDACRQFGEATTDAGRSTRAAGGRRVAADGGRETSE